MERSNKPGRPAPPPPDEIHSTPEDPRHQDELLDEAIQESFPASDPIAISIDKPRDADRSKGKSKPRDE